MQTVAIAGTRVAGDQGRLPLMEDPKERREHQVVIDAIAESLAGMGEVRVHATGVAQYPNLSHLKTPISVTLGEGTTFDRLVRALHPTPAVNGAPREEALALIDRYEAVDRGRYGGPVGWVDAAGNGAWAVGIRSAELDGSRARLFAGVGVVADSDPAAELAETRAKFQALLGALLRP